MSYRVDYGSGPKMGNIKRRASRVAVLSGLFFLCFLLLVSARWPKGRDLLRSALLPEKALTAAAALENFARDLQEDSSVSEALAVFWHQVGPHETEASS